MGAWVCGCVGVWVCGCGCVGVSVCLSISVLSVCVLVYMVIHRGPMMRLYEFIKKIRRPAFGKRFCKSAGQSYTPRKTILIFGVEGRRSEVSRNPSAELTELKT